MPVGHLLHLPFKAGPVRGIVLLRGFCISTATGRDAAALITRLIAIAYTCLHKPLHNMLFLQALLLSRESERGPCERVPHVLRSDSISNDFQTQRCSAYRIS